MSDKTFRQTVEEILRSGCRECSQGRECDQCKEDTKAILALIEQELEAKHNTTRWYTAKKHYDEGTETQEDRDILSGAIDSLDCAECMKQAKESIREELEAKQKPMVEALKEWKQVVTDSYKSPMPVDRVLDMLDDLIASVLEGK